MANRWDNNEERLICHRLFGAADSRRGRCGRRSSTGNKLAADAERIGGL